jgi:hypothetical protein
MCQYRKIAHGTHLSSLFEDRLVLISGYCNFFVLVAKMFTMESFMGALDAFLKSLRGNSVILSHPESSFIIPPTTNRKHSATPEAVFKSKIRP